MKLWFCCHMLSANFQAGPYICIVVDTGSCRLLFSYCFHIYYQFVNCWSERWHISDDQGKLVTCPKYQVMFSYTASSQPQVKMHHFDANPITIGYVVTEL